jgi:hypothetical protein
MEAINGTTLFNQSTYYYELAVIGTDVSIDTNAESKPFGSAILELPRSVLLGDDEEIKSILVLGNQHPEAVVRDMMRIHQFSEQSLKEYSMLTIGDIYLLSDENIYVAVNGDLTIRTRLEGFTMKRGVK